MLKKTVDLYLEAFRGLSKEVWWLALVTFINRAGTMILPFLSKYLKEDLHFTYGEVGWIMVFFGVGSFIGAWLGGKLTDQIGFYKVMIGSLLISGVLFILLQFVTSFWGLCGSILVVMSIADMFRPAMFVSLNTYSRPENRTRSLTLIRLAINLGFVIGPTVAGIIIMSSGYNMLFWIDGLTCIVSILLFNYLVKEIKAVKKTKEEIKLLDVNAAVFKDKAYWIFLAISFLIGVVFFQIFTTMPLYHKEHYGLSEFDTGMLFFLNGLIIIIFEMPMVNWIEKKKIKEVKLIYYSAILVTISFFILVIDVWAGILIISMVLVTLGEMVGFPYTNAFAMKRAKSGNEGRYMALYSMAFALAHIISPKLGLDFVAMYGYNANFILIGVIGLIAVGLSVWLGKTLEKEKILESGY
ncbi:MDR family MFS transporter [Arcticibacterium luteifluviistationis]|uniref:MFS transporter n=1 Tax=Arcticibacterium luteifluviistationis TaxID=1784714 RepID=A0A2Z4G6U0_9BACT|nr:MFS transporter [Arcticibacterium luteifluviistationis]AWV96876.1 MFS transporter [Arcticibacterium luteifluviistationis]